LVGELLDSIEAIGLFKERNIDNYNIGAVDGILGHSNMTRLLGTEFIRNTQALPDFYQRR